MHPSFNARAELAKHTWEEGKVIPLVSGAYRTRVLVTCYAAGRQKTRFANGEFPYGEYVELTRPDRGWIRQGTNIVPVLPDGRLIMVVEQRPPQWLLPNQPTTIMVQGKELDLREFGPYSSLEFPGGAVDEGDNFTSGFLHAVNYETLLSRFFQPNQTSLTKVSFLFLRQIVTHCETLVAIVLV